MHLMRWKCVVAGTLLSASSRVAGSGNGGNNNVSVPVSIPPSQIFEGDDGWWSTFIVNIGLPPQTVHLLPGTSAFAGTTIWAVLSEGCWAANPGLSNCVDARGGVFTRNQSTSWSTERLANGGLLDLNTYEEQYLGENFTGSAYYGFDTVTLGLTGNNLPTLQDQLVAGFATDNYFVGSLGLSPLSFNITDFNDPQPSVLGVLRNSSIVPSLSWAYAAGASYNTPPTYGSVIFGGYDEQRIDSTKVLRDIPFSSDTSRDLQVELRTVTYDTIGSTPLLTEGINVFLDSLISQMWLPETVCQRFEKAFNLTWNSTYQLYLLDDDVHATLTAQNPQITLQLGSSNGTVDITLPYAAFDLNVTLPITNGPMRYFPLQRAQNYTQYVLGRVFLQEAYIIADYDRRNFSVAQAVAQPASPQLVPICAPGEDTSCAGTSSHKGLSGGVIAGIAVAATAIALLVLGALFWVRRRRHRQAKEARTPLTAFTGDEKRDEKTDERQSEPFLPGGVELENREAALYEMDRNEFRPELGGEERKPRTVNATHEMGSGEVAAYELEAPVRS